MNIYENLKMSLDSIKANKLRSFLTMLGIIIGISSVITILSLGNGGKESIVGELEKIGSSTIQLKVNGELAEKEDYITLKDVKALKEKSQYIKYVSPYIMIQGVGKVKDKSKRAIISGNNAEFNYIQNNEILYGRYFTDREVEEEKNIGVIDEITAEYYFGYKDVVGESILVGKNKTYKKVNIVGVTKAAGYMKGAPVENIPAVIDMPITSAANFQEGDMKINNIYILVNSKDKVEEGASDAINIIEARHNNRGKNIYTAEKLLKQVEQVNKVIDIFTSFIGAVAAISLLVGGIGVMNIMLVSVTERTREIGIRKAIGATTTAILLQFLMESIIISLIGGIIGMILGVGSAFIIGSFVDVVPILSIKHIILVIIFSSAVGIFFGIYPARKAAKLNPIDALRYE